MMALNADAAHTRAKNARVNSNRDQALISTCIVDTPFLARSIGSNTSRPVTDNLPRIARHASVQDLSIVSIQRTENIGYTDGK